MTATASNPDLSIEDSRARLAAGQRDLVNALVSGGEPPAGFDPVRLEATSVALRRKRSYGVAHAWPALAASLGREFTPKFSVWARDRKPAGSFVDGYHFACALETAGGLPALGAMDLAAVRVRWTPRPDGTLRRRRGVAARLVRTERNRPCLFVGIAGFLLRYG